AVNPGDAFVRRNYVLDRMAQEGYLTAQRAAQLKQTDVRVDPSVAEDQFSAKLGYFIDYAKDALEKKYGSAQVFGGGLRVTTTLDQEWQNAAEEAVASHLSTKGDPSAALVAIDPRTGAVRALVGGKNWNVSKVNLATG